MMIKINWAKLPLYIYGKPQGESGGAKPESLQVIRCHSNFGEEELAVLNRIQKAFGWRSSGKHTYHDCYGFWPLKKHKSLIFRISDAGRDGEGRPHKLLLEAVLLDGAITENRDFNIVNLLCEEAWPDKKVMNKDTIALKMVDPRPELIKRFSPDILNDFSTPIIVGVKQEYVNTNTIFPVEINYPKNNDKNPELLSIWHRGTNLDKQEGIGKMSSPSETKKTKGGPFLFLICFAAITTGITAYQFIKLQELKIRIESLETENYELSEALEVKYSDREINLRKLLDESQEQLNSWKKWAKRMPQTRLY